MIFLLAAANVVLIRQCWEAELDFKARGRHDLLRRLSWYWFAWLIVTPWLAILLDLWILFDITV